MRFMSKWKKFLVEERRGLNEMDPGGAWDEDETGIPDDPEPETLPGPQLRGPNELETFKAQLVQLWSEWSPSTSEGKLYTDQLGAIIGKPPQYSGDQGRVIDQDYGLPPGTADRLPPPGNPNYEEEAP